ncbi:sensor histidine kinase [Desulfotomaculum sp. 1211_IL3151]|uniref:sensor histidine kinase n=1 Tax=Desulfotomaculum sp. 1211_IL3151 TaxID=3084055 RepID=UPI002FDA20ED
MFWQKYKQIIDNFTSLRWRLGVSYSVMAIVVTALLTGLAVQTAMTISMSAQKEQALSSITGVATAFADSLGSSLDPAQTAQQLGLAANGRVIWLGPDDRVRVDGYGDARLSGRPFQVPPKLKDPDVKAAEIYDTGQSWVAYTSAPLQIAGKTSGRLLLIQDLAALRQEYALLKQRLWLLGGVLSLIVAGIGIFLAGTMSRPLEALTHAIQKIRYGELQQSVPVSGSKEIVSLTEAFNQMTARVAKLDEQRRTFVANAAHELRTPLASLQALAEGMPQESVPKPEEMDAFVRQTERLGRLVDSLLQLARLDNPELQLNRFPIRVPNLIEEALWVVKPLAVARQLKLEIEADKELWIEGDPDWLHQAFVNVLSNAVYYTPIGSQVRLGMETKQGYVHIVIEDTGTGVSLDVLAQLGTRFYRPAAARERNSGGAGLGLSIVKEVLRLHQGRLEFASPPGKGLMVKLIVPEIAPHPQPVTIS